MIEKNHDFKSMRNEIYTHMLNTRGDKYKWFLRALRSFKYLSLSPSRGTFLESYYTLMRYIDDIVDGDAPLPEKFNNSEEFVMEKIQFAKSKTTPKDKVDYLMLYCFEAGNKFEQDFSSETEDILNSMLFDAKRHGKRQIFLEEKLHQHFFRLDIRGTIRATLKVFGEDPSKYELLKPLGFATRIQYNLEDYDDDIKAGLINFSKEDYERLDMRYYETRSSESVQNWMREQAHEGLKLIQEYQKNLKKANFSLLARLTLPTVYEIPAKKYFEKILQ